MTSRQYFSSSRFAAPKQSYQQNAAVAPKAMISITPEQQMALMYEQMMQMQQQMQHMQMQAAFVPTQTVPVRAPVRAPVRGPSVVSTDVSGRVPFQKQQRFPSRVLNAPTAPKSSKPVGRSGLPIARPERVQRAAPADDEVMRPYAFACHQFYVKLVRAADGAFYNIGDAASTFVKGIRLEDMFRCSDAKGSECTISVADIMYGFREKGGHFTQRRPTHAAYHITNPFEAAQMYALSKGYYLANTSDPSKGLTLRIEVFKADPQQSVPLWHGQNIQPNGVKLNADISDESFEDVNCFYMKPVREAARYVNSTFDNTLTEDHADPQEPNDPKVREEQVDIEKK